MVVRSVYYPNFKKRDGLVPVIVQEYVTGEVLMLAYANEECFLRTLQTGVATFWSTSRNKVWVKGEESGNVMAIDDVRIDCDGDALIYQVHPQGDGLACHTLARSCFYRPIFVTDTPASAPKAGEKEVLGQIEIEVHDNFND